MSGALGLFAAYAAGANLNPIPYRIANPVPGHSDVMQFQGEYFDTDTLPIRTRYAEVQNSPVPTTYPFPPDLAAAVPGSGYLPPDIVARFNTSSIAFTGMEIGFFRKDPNTGEEVAVPDSEQYNHHVFVTIFGQGLFGPQANLGMSGAELAARRSAVLRRTKIAAAGNTTRPRMSPAMESGAHHGVHRGHVVSGAGLPGDTMFRAFVGSEIRGTFTGLPKGYAWVVDRPFGMQPLPMLINTLNPAGGLSGGHGPQATNSTSPPGAPWSGLLECPCTDRISRDYIMTKDGAVYRGMVVAPEQYIPCPQIGSAEECFGAAADLGVRASANVTQDSAALGKGCYAHDGPTTSSGDDVVVYNSNMQGPSLCGPQSMEAYTGLRVAHGSVSALGVTTTINATLPAAEGSAGALGAADVVLEGPADVWFGAGFDAQQMGDLPFTIIAEGDGSVHARQLADHSPGRLLNVTLEVHSNTVADGVRTVRLTVPAADGGSGDGGGGLGMNGIKLSVGLVSIINAVGSGPAFAFHKSHASTGLALIAANWSNCICEGPGGYIGGGLFPNTCWDAPYTSLTSSKNPTCQVDTYDGGVLCCGHGTVLLDKAQEGVRGDAVDEVYTRVRMYYQPYDPQLHKQVAHFLWYTEMANPEYSIPQCAAGTPPEQCVHVLTSQFTGQDLITACEKGQSASYGPCQVPDGGEIQVLHAWPHLHSPAGLTLDLYDASTGQSVCQSKAVYGDSETSSPYSRPDIPAGSAVYNEKDYVIAIPPCVFAPDEPGLQKPFIIRRETRLLSIARYNSTFRHTGVMAYWYFTTYVPGQTRP